MVEDRVNFLYTSESLKREPTTEEVLQKAEQSFPDIIANPPLEHTSFVYSVPVMGEWKNGNVLRMLRGMLAQDTREGEPFEVQLIANVGISVGERVRWDGDRLLFTTDEGEKYLTEADMDSNKGKKLYKLLFEMKDEVTFLSSLVEVQSLARHLEAFPHDTDTRQHLMDMVNVYEDPLQKEIVKLAITKAQTISFCVIDATTSSLSDTPYKYVEMGSLRTLGADVAYTRYPNKNVVIGLFDADTIPEDNHAVRAVQNIFHGNPDVHYLFNGLSYVPSGVSKDFMSDAPREAIHRTQGYNMLVAHGSPQICLRMADYQTLEEISGYFSPHFYGDEDRDLSVRLIHAFGDLQQGLLMKRKMFSPTIRTKDRMDGTVDSHGRRIQFSEKGVQDMNVQVSDLISECYTMNQKIKDQSPEMQREITRELHTARTHYLSRERVQQRFNRRVLRTSLDAFESGYINNVHNKLTINELAIMQLNGGDALLHYLKSNKKLVQQVVSSPKDITAIRYLLRDSPDDLPPVPLTPFQKAIREYIGEVSVLPDLVDKNYVTVSGQDGKYTVEDLRTDKDIVSVMHASIIEYLSLGHVYRKFFETNELHTDWGDPAWLRTPSETIQPRFVPLKDRVEIISHVLEDTD